jgi:3-oxoacyl-[acyl-carrier-protein] synthase II
VVVLARVVITGVGVASPNGSSLAEFRTNLLKGVSGVESYTMRHIGEVPAGVCHFDSLRYQKRKEARRGTRAGSVAIWCAHEALADAGLRHPLNGDVGRATVGHYAPHRTGVYAGITEHGNVETENQVLEVAEYDFDLTYWSHHHNPRTVANNPAGEVTLSLGISGPAYCLGGACAAGNLGLIQGVQQLRLGEVDLALAGGVSESIHSMGIFASFRAQGALACHPDPTKASRPFDQERNGIVVSEGGCLFALERLEDALARGAKIYGEVIGYNVNSDAKDFVLPQPDGQAACLRGALERAGIGPEDVDLINSHATSTPSGDAVECEAIRSVFDGVAARVNNTKSFIGHTMGAAGALELAGNLPAFEDGWAHPTINVDALATDCALEGLVLNQPARPNQLDVILNMSFGMLGINSAVVVRRYSE